MFTSKKKFSFLILSTILVVFLGALFLKDTTNPHPCFLTMERIVIELGGDNFSVEVADTNETRQCGLSYRESLREGAGMLFVFENSDFHGIWMREMLFPIDIIWLDENFSIVDLKIGASPDFYPEIFTPKSPARFVIEVHEGVISTGDISIGDYAIIEL